MEKRIIFGIHHPELLKNYRELACNLGYLVDATDNPQDMLARLRNTQYQAYVMDINLGRPNSEDISPAVIVWEIVAPRVQEGLAKFVAISGNDNTIDQARERGIPVGIKGMFSLRDFLIK